MRIMVINSVFMSIIQMNVVLIGPVQFAVLLTASKIISKDQNMHSLMISIKLFTPASQGLKVINTII